VEADRIETFERMPVGRAVLKQVGPAVASQMVALIYSLADTFFVGLLNIPAQTAAITIVHPCFLLLTATANLFGVGGASLIARFLGRRDNEKAGQVSSFSFWGGTAFVMLYILAFSLFQKPILSLCGAMGDTYAFAAAYARNVVVIGGVPTVLNLVLGHLVRSEGSARQAGIGMMSGSVLNIFLDPFFVLPRFLDLGVAGAGMATAISNFVAVLYFLGYVYRNRSLTVLRLRPKELKNGVSYGRDVFALGLPSAVQYILIVAAVAALTKFVSYYGSSATAALGITKKIDTLPLYFAIGTSNGLLPLVAYNYAMGNYQRENELFWFGSALSVGFGTLCFLCFQLFPAGLVGLFIRDGTTISLGAAFLRRMSVAMPFMALCYPMTVRFQAIGRTGAALVLSIMRKGSLDIPLLFLMDALIPLYGCMWVQPIVDAMSVIVALIFSRMYIKGRQSKYGPAATA
jgi:multidrug efflux pump